jgi:hypothetical protein
MEFLSLDDDKNEKYITIKLKNITYEFEIKYLYLSEFLKTLYDNFTENDEKIIILNNYNIDNKTVIDFFEYLIENIIIFDKAKYDILINIDINNKILNFDKYDNFGLINNEISDNAEISDNEEMGDNEEIRNKEKHDNDKMRNENNEKMRNENDEKMRNENEKHRWSNIKFNKRKYGKVLKFDKILDYYKLINYFNIFEDGFVYLVKILSKNILDIEDVIYYIKFIFYQEHLRLHNFNNYRKFDDKYKEYIKSLNYLENVWQLKIMFKDISYLLNKDKLINNIYRQLFGDYNNYDNYNALYLLDLTKEDDFLVYVKIIEILSYYGKSFEDNTKYCTINLYKHVKQMTYKKTKDNCLIKNTCKFNHGDLLMNNNILEFKEKLYKFSFGIIDDDFPWDNVIISGGSTLECISLHKIHEHSDIDLFIYGETEDDKIEAYNNLLEYFNSKENLIIGTKYNITYIIYKNIPRIYQIIYTTKYTKFDVISDFDLNYVQILYDGENVLVTPEFIDSFKTKITKLNHYNTLKTSRLYKALYKGFSIKVNKSIYDNYLKLTNLQKLAIVNNYLYYDENISEDLNFHYISKYNGITKMTNNYKDFLIINNIDDPKYLDDPNYKDKIFDVYSNDSLNNISENIHTNSNIQRLIKINYVYICVYPRNIFVPILFNNDIKYFYMRNVECLISKIEETESTYKFKIYIENLNNKRKLCQYVKQKEFLSNYIKFNSGVVKTISDKLKINEKSNFRKLYNNNNISKFIRNADINNSNITTCKYHLTDLIVSQNGYTFEDLQFDDNVIYGVKCICTLKLRIAGITIPWINDMFDCGEPTVHIKKIIEQMSIHKIIRKI